MNERTDLVAPRAALSELPFYVVYTLASRAWARYDPYALS
jgi:hypothetical protein